MSDNLTHEDLSKKFKNNFDLVIYAIKLAKNMIRSGREPSLYAPVQNKASIVLNEIEHGRDRFEQPKKDLRQNAVEGRIVELQSEILLFEEARGKKPTVTEGR